MANATTINYYIVFDAAKMYNRIEEAKRFNAEHECLYKGDAAKNLAHVAPWLFTYHRDSIFAEWHLANGGRQNWGIIIESKEDFKTIYMHLKKFLKVKTEAGKNLYFRFYDPRVLPTFLETSDQTQLKTFFGPVSKYIMESQNGQMIEYRLTANQLIKNNSDFFTQILNHE